MLSSDIYGASDFGQKRESSATALLGVTEEFWRCSGFWLLILDLSDSQNPMSIRQSQGCTVSAAAATDPENSCSSEQDICRAAGLSKNMWLIVISSREKAPFI